MAPSGGIKVTNCRNTRSIIRLLTAPGAKDRCGHCRHLESKSAPAINRRNCRCKRDEIMDRSADAAGGGVGWWVRPCVCLAERQALQSTAAGSGGGGVVFDRCR